MRHGEQEVLNRIAHDVRSPLSVIVGTASALRDLAPDPAQRGLDKIIDEAHRVVRILDNALAATRLAHEPAVIREWIPVEELIGGALARVEAALRGRRVELAMEPTCLAHVELALVELALVNLLDNAIRHAGGVLVVAAREEAAATVLEVTDAGPGFAERAGRVEHGLGVVRAVVRAHGGALEILARGADPDMHGTTVRMRLPFGECRPDLESAG